MPSPPSRESMKEAAMDDLVPQRQVAATSSVRVSLIDYLVLQIVYEWNVLGRAELSAEGGRTRRTATNFTSEEAGARLRAVIVLIAGELRREGFPIELALRFQNPDLPGLDIVSSAAIDDAIGSMIDANCLAGPDRSAPHYTLTDPGDFILQRANSRINEYEELFLRMPEIFFAAADLVRYYARTAT